MFNSIPAESVCTSWEAEHDEMKVGREDVQVSQATDPDSVIF